MNILLTLLKLAPTIISTMLAVETVITTPKSGQTKKALVMACIHAAAEQGELSDNKVVAAVSSYIDATCDKLNTDKVMMTTSTK